MTQPPCTPNDTASPVRPYESADNATNATTAKEQLRAQAIEDLKLAIETGLYVSGAIAITRRTYGVPWEELAKATGWTVEQLKQADDPDRSVPTLTD